MAMTTITDLKDIFSGVSSIRISTSVQADLSTAAWDYELPVANDSFDITQDEGTINEYKVLGLSAAWSISGEGGGVGLSFTIPTVDDTFVSEFYDPTTSALTTASETINGVAGTFTGNGYFMKNDMFEGSALIISEAGDKALYIKHFKGYPAFQFNDPLAAPVAISLTARLVGGNEECDFALLTFTPDTLP
jgi:hypothetical protein